MDSMEKLLSELKAEYEQPTKPKQQPPSPPATPFIQSSPSKSASLIDNVLAQVKADFDERDKAIQLQKQQELEQEKIRQEQLKAQQLEALHKQAKDWLAKLDPLSAEGLWFERFAESYPSKLEAAIEYLQTQ